MTKGNNKRMLITFHTNKQACTHTSHKAIITVITVESIDSITVDDHNKCPVPVQVHLEFKIWIAVGMKECL